MEQKHQFVSLANSGRFTLVDLCSEFGISRKTAYKWIGRYRELGNAGLKERSRVPKSSPGRTASDIQRIIIAEKRRTPTWGPKKLRRVLEAKHDIHSPPACSTIGQILKRHGLVKSRRRRPGVFKVQRGDLTPARHSNHVWAVDFKGNFQLGDRTRCDPLTMSDLHSRYVLSARAMPAQFLRPTQQGFRAVFRRYGIPEIIRVDNGSPFGSCGAGGLTKLSVWWIGLGIDVEFTTPASPQENGSHERMHRTMKAECCRPASANLGAQQQRFDRWRHRFNQERPHEAIDMLVPADLYQASGKRLDEGIKPRLYELSQETKRVNTSGFIPLDGNNCFIGEAFSGVEVAIDRETESGVVGVRYANVRLGNVAESPNARLRPTAYAERWAKRGACSPK